MGCSTDKENKKNDTNTKKKDKDKKKKDNGGNLEAGPHRAALKSSFACPAQPRGLMPGRWRTPRRIAACASLATGRACQSRRTAAGSGVLAWCVGGARTQTQKNHTHTLSLGRSLFGSTGLACGAQTATACRIQMRCGHLRAWPRVLTGGCVPGRAVERAVRGRRWPGRRHDAGHGADRVGRYLLPSREQPPSVRARELPHRSERCTEDKPG